MGGTMNRVKCKLLVLEIKAAVNRCSAENGSNTPDFLLAEYLVACLEVFDRATQQK